MVGEEDWRGSGEGLGGLGGEGNRLVVGAGEVVCRLLFGHKSTLCHTQHQSGGAALGAHHAGRPAL